MKRIGFNLTLVLVLALVICVPANAALTVTRINASYHYNPDEETPSGQTWVSLRDAEGDGSTTDATHLLAGQLISSSTSGQYVTHIRSFVTFNTTSLNDTETITSVIASFPGASKTINNGVDVNLSLIDAFPTNKSSGTGTDYSKTTFTRQAADLVGADGGAWANFTITNTTYINRTGLTTYMLTFSADVDNTSPGWISGQQTSYLLGYDASLRMPVLTVTTGTLPSADYSVNSTQAYSKPAAFQFTDTSTGSTPTTWNWSFGDGTYSDLQNPTHTYSDYGLYPVILNVSNSDGSSETTINNKTGSIGVIDGAGWADSFSANSSTSYGYDNSGFIWDTTNGVLNASNSSTGNGEQIYYLASPFFNGTYEYNFTVKQPNADKNLFGAFLFGAQNAAQEIWYYHGTHYALYTKNQTILGEDWSVMCLDYVSESYGGTRHEEITCPAINYDTDHTYHVKLNWTPFSNTETINVTVDGSPLLSSNNNWINRSGYAGFARHEISTGSGTFWYDDLKITNEGNVSPAIAPTADFTAAATGTTVTFTDFSINTPTSWTWQYNQHEAPGWVQFSTSQNPSYNFVAGTYDINLTATNAAGSDSEVKTSFIVVSAGGESETFPDAPATEYQEAHARYATSNDGMITAMILIFLVAAIVGVAIAIKCIREGVSDATIPLIVGYFIGIFILVILFATIPAFAHIGEVI